MEITQFAFVIIFLAYIVEGKFTLCILFVDEGFENSKLITYESVSLFFLFVCHISRVAGVFNFCIGI